MAIDVLKTPSGFLKLCEIVIAIVMVGVSQGVDLFTFGDEVRTFFCGGVMISSLVVTPCLLIAYLRGCAREIQRTPLELKFNFVLAVLMLSAGAVIINSSIKYYVLDNIDEVARARDACRAVGSFGVINSAVYLLDTYFARQAMD